MKRIITLILCATMIGFVFYYMNDIVSLLASYFNSTPAIVADEKNIYSKEKDYKFVQISDDYVPYNYQDLLNIFYTVLDARYESFTFYCPSEYTTCIQDVAKISNEENVDMLTTAGNYVSPFNNFTNLKVQYDTVGEVTIDITYLYSIDDINILNNKVDELWKELVKEDMDNEDIIYAFHDYIINHTKYDEEYENQIKEDKTPTHQASKANGVFFEGYAICSGYTDATAIILDRLKIDNFRVASNTHVWNAVYINDKWLNLDLTWDDPVSQDHSVNNLLHKFFLIDTETLEEFDIEDHTFDKSVYTELK